MLWHSIMIIRNNWFHVNYSGLQGNEERPFGCNFCGKKFKFNYHRTAHEKFARCKPKQTSMKCNNCLKQFASKEWTKFRTKIHVNWFLKTCFRFTFFDDHILSPYHKTPWGVSSFSANLNFNIVESLAIISFSSVTHHPPIRRKSFKVNLKIAQF